MRGIDPRIPNQLAVMRKSKVLKIESVRADHMPGSIHHQLKRARRMQRRPVDAGKGRKWKRRLRAVEEKHVPPDLLHRISRLPRPAWDLRSSGDAHAGPAGVILPTMQRA